MIKLSRDIEAGKLWAHTLEVDPKHAPTIINQELKTTCFAEAARRMALRDDNSYSRFTKLIC